jgi:hypothetical protein
MKKILTTLLAIFTFATLYAQAPKGFNYQAVARNAAGQLITNRNVGVRISILQGSAMGTIIYQQEEVAATNANGLFTLIVGDNSDAFANINWANGPYFIKSEVDLAGGINYTLSATQKILAVPYALYANRATIADRMSDDWSYNEQDPMFRNWGYRYDSLRNAPTRLSQFINDLNLALSVSGDTLFVNGNYVVLPSNCRGTIEWDSVLNHPTRLSQFINDLNLSVSGDTLFVGGNNYVILPPSTGATTIEWDSVLNHPTRLSEFINDLTLTLSVSGDTLYVNGNYVVLPSNNQTTIEWDSVLNHPTNLSDFYNDLGFITTETQGLNDVIAINNNAYNQIKNVYTPTDPLDAANKAYVDSSLAAEVAALNARIDSLNNTYNFYFDSLNNRIFELEHPRIKGTLPGIFSVSANTKVNFSQGNLQYRPRIKTWRFAVNQYDVAGAANNNVYMQAYCSDWIDLFGYGTSGWDGGAGRYMPYETTTNNTEYTEDPNGNDLTGFYANADWGFYNPIINGGNQTALWRTLTSTEWTYLLTLRPNAAQLRGMATVENTPGFILLPDDWTCPSGLTFVNSDSSYTSNVYNAANWALMEAAGAVFLPAAGQRTSSSTSNVGTVGNYWTTSHVNGTTGYTFHIGPNANAMRNNVTYSTGCSVRLVHEY